MPPRPMISAPPSVAWRACRSVATPAWARRHPCVAWQAYGVWRAHGGGRAQARSTPVGGCAKGAGGWVVILTGAGRAVGVGAAAGVNALLAGPPEQSGRSERSDRAGRGGTDEGGREGDTCEREGVAVPVFLKCRVPDSVTQECCGEECRKDQLYACCSSKSKLKSHRSAESAYEVY